MRGAFGLKTAVRIQLVWDCLVPRVPDSSVSRSVFVALCVDGTDTISAWPLGICRCDDAACLELHMSGPESIKAYAG